MKNSIFRAVLLICLLIISQNLFSQILTFKYDSGGNQVERRYCETCSHMQKTSNKESVIKEDVIANQYEVKIYPNPTKDKVTLVWSKETDLLIHKIEYVAYNFTQFRPLEFKRGQFKAIIDLTKEPIGMYVVVFYLTNGEKLTYKILKH